MSNIRRHKVVLEIAKGSNDPCKVRLKLPGELASVVRAIYIDGYRFEGVVVAPGVTGSDQLPQESHFILRFGPNVQALYEFSSDGTTDVGVVLPLPRALAHATGEEDPAIGGHVHEKVGIHIPFANRPQLNSTTVTVSAPVPPPLPSPFTYGANVSEYAPPPGYTYLPPNDGANYLDDVAQFTRGTIFLTIETEGFAPASTQRPGEMDRSDPNLNSNLDYAKAQVARMFQ
jgi:hypothetical protein